MDEATLDAVLDVLGTTDESLTAEEISARIPDGAPVKDVRLALQRLHRSGDVSKVSDDCWRAVAVEPPPPRPPPGIAGNFTQDELRRARERHGTTKDCTKCGKRGDIDQRFGWRRMRPHDVDIEPQAQCTDCRHEK